MTFNPGQRALLDIGPITNAADNDAIYDPLVLNLTVWGPDGAVRYSWSWPSGSEITHPGTGRFRAGVPLDVPGTWTGEATWDEDTESEGAQPFVMVVAVAPPANADARRLVRLEIGDDGDTQLFSDPDIDLILARNNGDSLLTAADLCDILARRYAKGLDFTWQNQSFKQQSRAKTFADLAAELRERALKAANGAMGVIKVHNVHEHHPRGGRHGRDGAFGPLFDCDFDTTLIREREDWERNN